MVKDRLTKSSLTKVIQNDYHALLSRSKMFPVNDVSHIAFNQVVHSEDEEHFAMSKRTETKQNSK